MKQVVRFLLVLLLIGNTGYGYAAGMVQPGLPVINYKGKPLPPATVEYLKRLTPGEYYPVTGKKLHLANRLALRLYQWKLRKQLPGNEAISQRQRKLGLLSLIFGAGAFVIAIIPILGILSIPAAITAIILGIISLRGNSNTNAILGIVFGSVFILLLAFIIVLVLAIVSLW